MRRPKERAVAIAPAVLSYLETGEWPESGEAADVAFFDRVGADDSRLRGDWEAVREPLLAKWATAHPGRRPWAWWRWDAPKEPVMLAPGKSWTDADRMQPHRRRVGGTGTPRHQVWGCALDFDHGIPTQWFSAWELAYYTGRAVDIHGAPIGQEFVGHHLVADALDPNDPPRFEGEASYLQRHGLFLPGEAARLTPTAFEPEVLAAGDDDDARRPYIQGKSAPRRPAETGCLGVNRESGFSKIRPVIKDV
jgi:hypothetical protein